MPVLRWRRPARKSSGISTVGRSWRARPARSSAEIRVRGAETWADGGRDNLQLAVAVRLGQRAEEAIPLHVLHLVRVATHEPDHVGPLDAPGGGRPARPLPARTAPCAGGPRGPRSGHPAAAGQSCRTPSTVPRMAVILRLRRRRVPPCPQVGGGRRDAGTQGRGGPPFPATSGARNIATRTTYEASRLPSRAGHPFCIPLQTDDLRGATSGGASDTIRTKRSGRLVARGATRTEEELPP